MINSKKELNAYLRADEIAQNYVHPRTLKAKLYRLLVPDEIHQFKVLLRKIEYYRNKKGLYRFYYAYLLWRFHKKSLQLHFYIEPNCFGKGLAIAHPGVIMVSSNSKIGCNCLLHPPVTIGVNRKKSPRIGNNVFIGSGAVIAGEIIIADGVAIGCNSAVTKSFLEPNITIAGNPARKVSNRGSKAVWIHRNFDF